MSKLTTNISAATYWDLHKKYFTEALDKLPDDKYQLILANPRCAEAVKLDTMVRKRIESEQILLTKS